MREIKKIIVHCSASDSPLHNDIRVIRTWHMDKGWDDVGYHYFIRNDGVIEYGRPLAQVGAHCKGHNTDSVGICLSGNTQFNFVQYQALNKLIDALKLTLGPLDVYPHNHFNKNKTCPNFDLKQLGY